MFVGKDKVLKVTGDNDAHQFVSLPNSLCSCSGCFELIICVLTKPSGSADRTVKFWDLETFELIGSTRPEVYQSCFISASLMNDDK